MFLFSDYTSKYGTKLNIELTFFIISSYSSPDLVFMNSRIEVSA